MEHKFVDFAYSIVYGYKFQKLKNNIISAWMHVYLFKGL